MVIAVLLFGIAYGIPFSHVFADREEAAQWPSKATDALLLAAYFTGALLHEPVVMSEPTMVIIGLEARNYAAWVLALGAVGVVFATLISALIISAAKDFATGFRKDYARKRNAP